MNNMSSLSRLFRSSPLFYKQLFSFPANNHVSDPIFPLASKIMPDDIYRKRDSMQLVGR